MKTLSAIAIFAITVAGMVHAQDASLEARREAAIEAKQQYVGAASPDASTFLTQVTRASLAIVRFVEFGLIKRKSGKSLPLFQCAWNSLARS